MPIFSNSFHKPNAHIFHPKNITAGEQLLKVEDAFRNLTNLIIPENVQALLSYGPKFMVPHANIMVEQIQEAIQQMENHVMEEDPNTHITKFKNWKKEIQRFTFENNANSVTLSNKDTQTIKAVKETELFLREHKNVMIIEADKGKITVIIFKNHYKKLIKGMLEKAISKGLYGRIETVDEKTELENQNRLLKNCQEKLKDKIHLIGEEGIYRDRTKPNIGKEKKWIDALRRSRADRSQDKSGNILPTMHPLLKLHKPELEIRPIISKVNTTNHKMGQIINEVLTAIKREWNNENKAYYNISNIADVPKNLRRTMNGNITDQRMAVLDIKDMYNSINKGKLLTILEELIDNNGKYNTKTLMALIKFDLFHNNNFIFEHKLYTQKRGLPMGAPTSGIYAEVYTDFYLNIKASSLQEAGLIYMNKYIDDIIIIGNKSISIENIKEILEKGTDLLFTSETEENKTIEYLDTKITRREEENRYETEWNKKTYTSSRILNERSNHPRATKIGTITSRILHITRITSPNKLEKCISKLFADFLKNGYDRGIIQSTLRNTIRNENNNIPNDKKIILKTIIGNIKSTHTKDPRTENEVLRRETPREGRSEETMGNNQNITSQNAINYIETTKTCIVETTVTNIVETLEAGIAQTQTKMNKATQTEINTLTHTSTQTNQATENRDVAPKRKRYIRIPYTNEKLHHGILTKMRKISNGTNVNIVSKNDKRKQLRKLLESTRETKTQHSNRPQTSAKAQENIQKSSLKQDINIHTQ